MDAFPHTCRSVIENSASIPENVVFAVTQNCLMLKARTSSDVKDQILGSRRSITQM